MKWTSLKLPFFISVFLGLCGHLYGWESKVMHPALTQKAIERDNPACVIDRYLKTNFVWQGRLIFLSNCSNYEVESGF